MKRLALFLMIVLLVLAGCGGGDADTNGSDADTNGGDADTNGGDESGSIVAPVDATAKGAIEYDSPVEDEIADSDEAHAYEFEGAEGDEVTAVIVARGSAFTSPYFFVYDPDGELLINNNTEESSRSSREIITLEADGTYTIVVQPFAGRGMEQYELRIETP